MRALRGASLPMPGGSVIFGQAAIAECDGARAAMTSVERRVMNVLYWRLILGLGVPSMLEISFAIGWNKTARRVRSGGKICYALERLERYGLISRQVACDRHSSRAIQLTALGRAWCPFVCFDSEIASAIPEIERTT